jgi:hypothetical protein
MAMTHGKASTPHPTRNTGAGSEFEKRIKKATMRAKSAIASERAKPKMA